jgi:hypothetical protein
MSLLKSNSVQIGQSATATQNFTLSVPSSPDGTIKLARGNSGATTADVLTVDASGNVTTTLADGIVTPAKLSQPMTLATAQATTSGTAIDFTGIPSWVKRITVMFDGVSTNGTSVIQVQVGSGSFTTSEYSCVGSTVGASSVASVQYTSGFGFGDSFNTATRTKNGSIQISNVSSNIWSSFGGLADSSSARTDFTSGVISISGTLDRVRITTVNGTDTFDAGSVNILYEG